MQELRWASLLAPSLFELYELAAARVARELGVSVEIVPGSYAELEAGAYDFAFVCGLPYTQLSDRLVPVAAPLLCCHPGNERPTYFSDVIVRADGDVSRFEDLRGRRWAYNEPRSQSGYGVVRAHVAELGCTSGFFGEVVRSGWHHRSIAMVCSGRVDGSAIDCQVFALAQRRDPSLGERLRIVDSLGPSTVQPLVARRNLPASLVDDVRSALLSSDEHFTRRLERYFVTRFIGVGDADYDDIRAMATRSVNTRLERAT